MWSYYQSKFTAGWQTLRAAGRSSLKWLRPRRRLLLAAFSFAIAIPAVAVISAYVVVEPNSTYVVQASDAPSIKAMHIHAGIVMGAGITQDGKPFRELQSRLDVAADALNAGYVDKLVLSGDNHTHDYNEPKAMLDYLVRQRGIDPNKLQPDYAGRSTYETCERASKIFGMRQAIVFSAGSHLPRAIYLCRQFGIETYGVASHAEANNALRREALARVKAVANVYISGERTILGAPISL